MKNIFTYSLTLALIAILFVQNANAANPPVTVTGSTGANNTYSFLKSAFDAINANPNQSGMNKTPKLISKNNKYSPTINLIP